LKETGFDAVQATALTAAVSVAQLFAVAVLMKYVDTGKFQIVHIHSCVLDSLY
jgi:hypothetical protein